MHYVRTLDLEERVLQDIANNPSVNSRQLARQYDISQTIVLSILHDNHYYPYHLQRVQALSRVDFPPRE